MTMRAEDKDDDLVGILKVGYDVPPPTGPFAEDLLERMRGELRAARPRHPGPGRAVLALRRHWRLVAAAALVAALGIGLAVVANRGVGPDRDVPGAVGPVAESTPDSGRPRMVALDVKLPPMEFGPTPKNIPPSPYLEKYPAGPRPPLMVPEGTTNVALGKPVTASDNGPVVGEARMVTDGNKATEIGHLELGPGKQWVQIDLKEPCAIYAILVWHYHAEGRVYHDVVVQVADDPDFIENVRTVYNNDYDNSSGLGIGKDLEYIEDHRGRLIATGGIPARYVRLYSNGNSSNDLNHYVEVDVYGTPVEGAGDKQVPLKAELPRPAALR
jgi:hypothetical protein